jgi:hypothetical protein
MKLRMWIIIYSNGIENINNNMLNCFDIWTIINKYEFRFKDFIVSEMTNKNFKLFR